MKKLSLFLIILGVVIAGIPLYNQAYTWYWQSKVLDSYEQLDTIFLEEPENTASGPIVSDPNENIYIPPELDTPDSETALPGEPSTTVTTETPDTPPVATEVKQTTAPQAIGILKIDKIKVKLPIFSGATTPNMKIGAGWMKQTTPIGQNGNSAIAAHRSHTYGRFFNRLDEIVVNDTFTITVGKTVNRYVVFNKVVVEPTDISVLKQPKDDQIITLITCTPFITATHRLIIQGRPY